MSADLRFAASRLSKHPHFTAMASN
jgi:hypothetical protein